MLDLDSRTFMPLRFDVIVRYRLDLSVSVGMTSTRSSVSGTNYKQALAKSLSA